MKIGVIAGTPVDTKMGVEYILSKGFDAIGFACSDSAEEQAEMQILHKEELMQVAIDGCLDMVKNGAESIFVYCNSLSSAINTDKLKAVVPVFVVTPLDVYKSLAKQYSCLSVVAANGQSLAGIERIIMGENANCLVYGAALPPLVHEIEADTPPSEIYKKFELKKLTDSFASIGCEALILGCTHFPYIEKEIADGFAAEIINPSDRMLDMIRQANGI